jgi:hypothetical protein
MFRETLNGDLSAARSSIKAALHELFDRHKKTGAHKWIANYLQTFDAKALELKRQDQNGIINLQSLLFPVPGRMSEH